MLRINRQFLVKNIFVHFFDSQRGVIFSTSNRPSVTVNSRMSDFLDSKAIYSQFLITPNCQIRRQKHSGKDILEKHEKFEKFINFVPKTARRNFREIL